MIGDRMDTDIVTGIESGLDTVLVLSGVSTRETVKLFPIPSKTDPQRSGEIFGLNSSPKQQKPSAKEAENTALLLALLPLKAFLVIPSCDTIG